MLVLIKSCQGIVYYHSDECKIYRMGYTVEQARALIAALSKQQIDSLIARGEHDTIAIPLLDERYFISANFDRYLAYHKKDSTRAPLSNIIALVNIGADQDRETCAVPCDTSKGQLMLVNGTCKRSKKINQKMYVLTRTDIKFLTLPFFSDLQYNGPKVTTHGENRF